MSISESFRSGFSTERTSLGKNKLTMSLEISFAALFDNAVRYARRTGFILAPSVFGDTPVMRARFNDAVFISQERGFLFSSNEKVANSTMRATFQALEGGGALPRFYKPFKRWTGPLRQPSDIDDIASVLADPSIYKFCVTRHPYARLVSCYRNKFERAARGRGFPKMMRQLGFDPARDEITFGKFIAAIARQDQRQMNPHWRPQYYNVFMDHIAYDEVISYEGFAARASALIEKFYPEMAGNSLVSANRQTTNSDQLVGQYFDEELKARAQEIYAIDFERFGYER